MMNISRITGLFALGCICSTLGTHAQSDPVNREMTIESEFMPIVKEATKISLLPEIEKPKEKKSPANFSTWSVPALLSPEQILLPATDNPLSYPFSQERGYAFLKGGNYANINAGVGYKIIDNKSNDWRLSGAIANTNGKVSYVQFPGKKTAKNIIGEINSSYTHRFDPMSLMVDLGYNLRRFNYYGHDLDSLWHHMNKEYIGKYKNEDQQTQQISSRIGIQSNTTNPIGYKASIAYNRFDNKLGFYYNENGSTENHVQTHVSLQSAIDSSQYVSVDLQLDNLFYNGKQHNRNYSMFTFNPYWKFERDQIIAKLGVVMNYTHNQGTKLRFAPDVEVEWRPADVIAIYGEATGGKKLNSMREIAQENIYQNPSYRPNDSYGIDMKIGMKANPFPGFSANAYVGFSRVKDMIFNYRQSNGILDLQNDSIPVSPISRNTVESFNQNVYSWNAGIILKYKYKKLIETSLDYKHNAYHLQEGGKEFNLNYPKNELKMELTVKPIEALGIGTSYYFGSGRTYYNRILQTETIETGKLRNISEWNIGATYSVTRTLQFSLQLCNILNKKYDIWYGMPAQGIRFMIGANIAF